jgi:AcrR family transcriptional regulator
LTDADIIDAAIQQLRQHGPSGLSMRSVARALGVPPMTIYGYVPNKEALDRLVVDHVLADVRIPDPEEGPWEDRLLALLCDVRRTLIGHPPLAAASGALEPGALHLLELGGYGTEATRLTDGVHGLLREGGFRRRDLDTCFGALFTYVTGHTELDATFEVGLRALIEGCKLVLRTTRTRHPARRTAVRGT